MHGHKVINFDFILKYCLFGGVKLAKNADPDKYVYTGYGTGFDSHSKFALPDSSVGKNNIIFGVDVSSLVHTDCKKEDISWKSSKTTIRCPLLTAEAQYSINFSRSI